MAISRDSLLTLEAYARERQRIRAEAMAHKRLRTVHVGPNMTLMFEDETTIRYQIQEMLRIERTFEEAGIQDELDAYNPLVPDGDNFKCTQLLEFPDESERRQQLRELRGVESRTYLQVGDCDPVYAIADEDMERANEEKTSAVHFLRFQLPAESVAALREGQPLAIGVDHPNYSHRLDEVAPETQAALVEDLH